MGEEFYSSIKLISGEEIFSLISVDENDGDPVIMLQNPVIMKIIYTNHGQLIKLKPWMEIPTDDFFIIKLDKVITMTEVDNELIINLYKNFIEDEFDLYDDIEKIKNKINGKVKLSNKMGYIASVEESRKVLEDIFKGIKES